MTTGHLREPWRSFLRDVDRQLSGPTELHCLGGFVLAERYGLLRPTADVDIIDARGTTDLRALQQIGGKGSELARNADHDREDVKHLALGPGLDCNVLKDRYQRELRFQLGNTRQSDLTMGLWIEMIAEVQDRATG